MAMLMIVITIPTILNIEPKFKFILSLEEGKFAVILEKLFGNLKVTDKTYYYNAVILPYNCISCRYYQLVASVYCRNKEGVRKLQILKGFIDNLHVGGCNHLNDFCLSLNQLRGHNGS